MISSGQKDEEAQWLGVNMAYGFYICSCTVWVEITPQIFDSVY